MKSFETIYKELEDLFINKLPDYIKKVNEENNDGIILKSFENTKLEEKCLDLPSFKFSFEQAEYEEKDRIIENTVYEISFEINMQLDTEQKTILFYRYVEAINMTIKESECWQQFKITNIFKNKIVMRITV